MKNRILFMVQLPPPLHGSSSINKIFIESKIINAPFNICVLPLRFAKSMEDIGSFSLLKALKMFSYAFKLMRELITFKPDLVYFSFSSMGISFYRDVLYALILKLFNSKIVYHLHVKGIKEESERSSLKRLLYKFAFKNTNIISLSQVLALDVSSVHARKPFVVNNGIHSLFDEYEKSNKVLANKPVELLYLSNLMRTKGIFVFLDALTLLDSKRINFFARIIGKPADISKNEVEQYLLKNNLTNKVIIEDAKYGEEKYTAFKNADMFIHPSLNDAFPLVILEAMQFQLPVISTFEGAIPEIIEDGITGYLVPKNDEVALANKIEILIADQEARINMGKEGRKKFLLHYTAEVMEQNLETVLLKLL